MPQKGPHNYPKKRHFRTMPDNIEQIMADCDACDFNWGKIADHYCMGNSKNPMSSIRKRLLQADKLQWFYEQRDIRRKELYEKVLDKAEDELERVALHSKITREKVTALALLLKTKGKSRGFTEKSELDVTTGGEKINTIRLIEVRGPNTPQKID